MVFLDLETVAMFAPWRSQKFLRKHKDPITGNAFIGLVSQIGIIAAIILREFFKVKDS